MTKEKNNSSSSHQEEESSCKVAFAIPSSSSHQETTTSLATKIMKEQKEITENKGEGNMQNKNILSEENYTTNNTDDAFMKENDAIAPASSSSSLDTDSRNEKSVSSSKTNVTKITTKRNCHPCSTIQQPSRKRLNRNRNRCRPLHVEVIVHPAYSMPLSTIRKTIQNYIDSIGRSSLLYKAGPVDLSTTGGGIVELSDIIRNACLDVSIADFDEHEEDEVMEEETTSKNSREKNDSTSRKEEGREDNGETVAFWQISTIKVHAYILNNEEAEQEEIDNTNDDDDDDLVACETLALPHASLHTSWDNLILQPQTKQSLLEYATTALLFSDVHVSPHIVSWNKLVLLHGPPGTGKTSLCRALAQKLAIRLSDPKYFPSGGYLLEIHSHSLFSKWFSESGKLVHKLFARIREKIEDDPNALICVLVDEVESLAAMRAKGGGESGTEPSDAIRAVNSLLTSIDRLKKYRNVIVMTTTNITQSVDSAFVDRADIKQYIGLPTVRARYEILRSCVDELIRVGIVTAKGSDKGDKEEGNGSAEDDGEEVNGEHDTSGTDSDGAAKQSNKVRKSVLPSYRQLTSATSTALSFMEEGSILLECAKNAEGMSGRCLRRLPFQSHALFIQSNEPASLREFVDALLDGIEHEQEAKNALNVSSLS